MELDFLIVTPVRSGTNMLMFALDSHPDIQMLGSLGVNNNYMTRYSHSGKILGAAKSRVPMIEGYDDDIIIKCITINRNPYDMAASLLNSGLEHHFEKPGPVVLRSIPSEEEIQVCVSMKNRIQDWVKAQPDHLILDYTELTGDGHIDEFSEQDSHRICDFLEVDRRILKCSTFKPVYEQLTIGGQPI